MKDAILPRDEHVGGLIKPCKQEIAILTDKLRPFRAVLASQDIVILQRLRLINRKR